MKIKLKIEYFLLLQIYVPLIETTTMNSHLLLRNEVEEMWKQHFHMEKQVADETEFKKNVQALAQKYGADAVAQFKAVKTVKRQIIPYFKKYYRKWYERGYFTLFQLSGFIPSFAFYDDVEDELVALLQLMEEEERQGRLAKAKGPKDLKDLASDTQNVHTGVVVAQTNTMMESVKNITIDAKQKTLSEIEAAWIGMDYVNYDKLPIVLEDMRKWGNTESVCAQSDWAYRKALRSLWARAKGHPDLVQRLWEECLDSVGVCAQGHLTRLANVLVGFVEDAVVPVSKKELFQQAMSALGAQDRNEEDKRMAALALFNEYTIPEEERGAWLEAVFEGV